MESYLQGFWIKQKEGFQDMASYNKSRCDSAKGHSLPSVSKFLTSTFKSVGMSLVFGLSLSSCTGSGSQTETGPQSSKPGTVSVLGTITGEQQRLLEAALAPFEEETGIDVIYEGTDASTTLLQVRIDSNNSPDVAMLPQPGLMRSLAEEGALVPLDSAISRETLAQYYPENWIELSEVNDQVYGVWYKAAVKSLVWYVPEEFEQGGYQLPETWDEMMALSDRMVADGKTPWCIGLESGSNTGWPGTDWIEEIVLRQSGPEFYDKWVEHQVPFNSPQVQEAFNYFGDIVKKPGYVYGGKTGALSISMGDSIQGLFGENPDCLMHRQADFAASFFPDNVVLGKDVDFFPTPNINPQYDDAVLVAGDIFSMLNDTPEARKLMAYLATPKPHEIWAAQGGFLSANKQVDLSIYPDEITRKEAALLTDAAIVRFDGSDMMPGAVGAGTFWSGIMNFVAGESAKKITDQIEAYWPSKAEQEAVSKEAD